MCHLSVAGKGEGEVLQSLGASRIKTDTISFAYTACAGMPGMQAVEAHMSGLLSKMARVRLQRTDPMGWVLARG